LERLTLRLLSTLAMGLLVRLTGLLTHLTLRLLTRLTGLLAHLATGLLARLTGLLAYLALRRLTHLTGVLTHLAGLLTHLAGLLLDLLVDTRRLTLLAATDGLQQLVRRVERLLDRLIGLLYVWLLLVLLENRQALLGDAEERLGDLRPVDGVARDELLVQRREIREVLAEPSALCHLRAALDAFVGTPLGNLDHAVEGFERLIQLVGHLRFELVTDVLVGHLVALAGLLGPHLAHLSRLLAHALRLCRLALALLAERTAVRLLARGSRGLLILFGHSW
jgi:hypothetical protein